MLLNRINLNAINRNFAKNLNSILFRLNTLFRFGIFLVGFRGKFDIKHISLVKTPLMAL